MDAGGPFERFGVLVALVDVAGDSMDQLRHTIDCQATQLVFGQFTEEPLDDVEP